MNLLNILDCLDFSYIYDNLFRKTNFHTNLKSLNKESLKINQESLKINQDSLVNEMETKNSADSVNSNQSWDKTNDEFTSYSGMETHRMCNKVNLTFNLKYNYNIPKWWIIMRLIVSCLLMKFITRWKLQINIIPFVRFPPNSTNINILPFVIDTPIIDNINNKKVYKQLDKLDMLHFNEGICFSDNIIQCFLLWMKYQSPKIEFVNSQCFHGDDNIELIPKIITIKDHF